MRQPVKDSKASGFTLAELLIVALVISVLVGVAMPSFTGQLEKARQSTDIANLRGAFATARIAEISGDVLCGGYKIRISGDDSDLRPGDAGRATVFWYDADRGLYPDKDSLKPDSDTADLSGITANKALITSRLMARGTRVVIDDGLPAVITYGNDGELPGQFSAHYADMRIRVAFTKGAGASAYALSGVAFADIMNDLST